MRKYETRQQTGTYEKLVEIACDLCGRKATNESWDAGTYEVNDVEIEVKIKQRGGDSYPEGGSGTEHRIDLCPTCFKERLVPWLRSQGATVEETEWDW